LVKRALLFSSLFFILISLSSCQIDLEPTYKENDVPHIVKKICKEEYDLEVITKRTKTTLWIYAPVDKILHDQYGIIKNKILDEEMAEKSRNILSTVGRVLISSDNTPEFFVLLISDITEGLDYTIIASVLDLKKSYAGFLPWIEANKRYVFRFENAQEAIGDKTGKHLKAYDIALTDFLAEQIAQRIGLRFEEDDLIDSFKVQSVNYVFANKSFKFYIDIKKIKEAEKEIDITIEALKIAAFVIKDYDFNDFLDVEIYDLNSGKKLNYGRLTLGKFK